jgi:hypothetical protein
MTEVIGKPNWTVVTSSIVAYEIDDSSTPAIIRIWTKYHQEPLVFDLPSDFIPEEYAKTIDLVLKNLK